MSRRAGAVVGIALLAVGFACTPGKHAPPTPRPETTVQLPATARVERPTSSATAPSSSAPAPTPVPTPLALGGSPGCATPFPAGDTVDSLVTSNGPRGYRLHVPPRYDAKRGTPVVFNFHGSNRSAYDQESYTGLWRIADRETFILIGPEGLGGEWDIDEYYADDVAFVLALLDRVSAQLCVDQTRVYATGFSNGAEMASLLGCRAPQLFAAIAPVSGVEYDYNCGPEELPVLSFQGTDDHNVYFDEAPPAMEQWATHNRCAETLTETRLSASVVRQSYDGCGVDDVILYIIEGGGHTWPGADDDAGGSGGIGFTTHEINANDVIWKFFAGHRRKP